VRPEGYLLDNEVRSVVTLTYPTVVDTCRGHLRGNLAARATASEVVWRVLQRLPRLRFSTAAAVIRYLAATTRRVLKEALRRECDSPKDSVSLNEPAPDGCSDDRASRLTYADLPEELHEPALAWTPEDALLQAERTALVDPAFIHDMRRSEGDPIGTSAHDERVQVRLARSDIAGGRHALVLGATGSGKTRAVAGIIRQLLRGITRGSGLGMVIVDHKSELVELARELVAEVAEGLPTPQADRLLGKLVVVNPFSEYALVPLQILRPEPGVAPEVQAFDVTSVVDRLGGANLGVRQDAFLFHLALLGITTGRSLPQVSALLADSGALTAAAAAAPHPDIRAYFSGVARIASGSLEGVRTGTPSASGPCERWPR
jgi:hypothetical protein